MCCSEMFYFINMSQDTKRFKLFLILLLAAKTCYVTGCRCYGGWVLWNRTCYKTFDLSLTWSDAQRSCQANGGRLVKINSQIEYNFLATFLPRDVSFWIGLHYQDGSMVRPHKDDDKGHHEKTAMSHKLPSYCYVVTKTGSARRESKKCAEHFRFVCEKKAVAALSPTSTTRHAHLALISHLSNTSRPLSSRPFIQANVSAESNTSRVTSNTAADSLSLPSAGVVLSKAPSSRSLNASDTAHPTQRSSSTERTNLIPIFSHINMTSQSSTTLQTAGVKFNTWSPSQEKQSYLKCDSLDDSYCISPEVWRGKTSIERINAHLNRAHSRLDSLTQHTLLSSPQHSLLEDFFFLVNFFIEGSYSKYWVQLNESICNVVELVEPFLDTHVHQALLHNDAMFHNFSYLDIGIQHVKQSNIDEFEFTDSRGVCNINKITLSNKQTRIESIILATVVMNIPSTVIAAGQSEDITSTEWIVSPILSFSAYTGVGDVSLQPDFSIRHYDLQNKPGNKSLISFRCAFWDGQNRKWSTFGCSVLSEDNKKVNCQCNHTTNFAILMQIHQVNITADHAIALSIITYIGCSITLLTQFMAVTVFTFVRSLNSERVFIHRNLCIAIGAAQITFLAGIKAVNFSVVCAVVALVLHYCYTSVFIWMLVEGLHLYSKVVQVFGTEKSRNTYYMIFGWGVPLILVVISAGADWEGYGTSYSCWLSTRRNTIWAFVGPALAIIIVNVIILAAVVRIVMASAKLNKLGEFDHIRAGIKGTLFLLPLLGLTWMFGLVAVNEEMIVFQYLFAIFNSLQGFFVFLFHCVLNTEVRQALKRLKERRSLQNLSSGYSSQSVSHSTAWLPTKPSKQRHHRPNQVTPQSDIPTTTTTAVASWCYHRQSKETDESEITGSSRSSPDTNDMKVMFI